MPRKKKTEEVKTEEVLTEKVEESKPVEEEVVEEPDTLEEQIKTPLLSEEEKEEFLTLDKFLYALYCESESPTIRGKIQRWRTMLSEVSSRS